MLTDLILGTAGHIDHGKTSLIRALTGVDTDRLPEEKKRGITIELGFAELVVGDFRLGIVDVPGHEKFVRNMLAGATGMDLAMLVVAADDSVKQQTREHLDILRLLDLPAGLIVVTKVDLVDPEWLSLVDEELHALVQGTFLAQAPIVHTSVVTGAGLDELRRTLVSVAERARHSAVLTRAKGPFRMAIDRSFTIAGHGTVVTGSVASGQARVDEELAIEPGGLRVRIRGLQNHDRSVSQIQRGQRAAVNLAGVHHDEIRRGQELATIGHLVPSKLLTVWLTALEDAPRPIKDRDRIRFHVGTAELMGGIRLLHGGPLSPGESGPAQVFLSAPAVATWNQPFVVRSESPARTIGGGRVIDPTAERIRNPNEFLWGQLEALRSAEPLIRAGAALYFAGWRDWKPDDLSRAAGILDVQPVYRDLVASGECREITLSPSRTLRVHRQRLVELCTRIESTLRKMHDRHPLLTHFPRSQLAHLFAYLGDERVLDAALALLAQQQRVQLSDGRVGLSGQGPKLSRNEQKLLAKLIEWHRTSGLQPPTIKECRGPAEHLADTVPQLLTLAAAQGALVAISPEFYLHVDHERAARESLRPRLKGTGLTVSEIREILNTSRKYAVPYCEYLDRIGFTTRAGDRRVLAESAEATQACPAEPSSPPPRLADGTPDHHTLEPN